MDCVTAAPFISMLYDSEKVPEDVRQHVLHCVECRKRLQEYSHLTAEIRLVAAQEPDFQRRLDLPLVPRESSFLSRMGTPVRIPRFAVALALVALIVVSFGWFHTAAQAGASPMFRAQFSYPNLGAPQVLSRPHEPNTFIQSVQIANGEYKTLAVTMEIVDIQDQAVQLRLRAKLFNKKLTVDEAKSELKNVPFHELTYIPGNQATVEVASGETLSLTGSIVRESNVGARPSGSAALLPGPDEMVLSSPVLIADQRQIVGSVPASGTRIHCNQPGCGIWLYIPNHGVFVFAKQQWQDATRGIAAVSQLQFSINGHDYLLYSGIPIAGGQQPGDIWVRHDPGYLPSQHGESAAADQQTMLGSGDFTRLYATVSK